MEYEQNQGAYPHHRLKTQLTYGELLAQVRDQRGHELAREHAGRPSNVNAVLNTTRSLTAFLEAVGLTEADIVGREILDSHEFEKWTEKLEGAKDTARRRRSELTKHVRPIALAIIRAFEVAGSNESFGERLNRLRIQAGLSNYELAKLSSLPGENKQRSSVSAWLSGEYLPTSKSIEKVSQIAKLLDVDPSYLLETIPQNRRYTSTKDTGLPSSISRRVSQHLPEDFDYRSNEEKEQVLGWVSENILTIPKEVLDDGDVNGDIFSTDVSYYVLSRDPNSRSPLAPAQFISELDEVHNFKTKKLLPRGMKRNTVWGSASAERADYYLRAIPGALHAMGMPTECISLAFPLFPEVIDRYIEWKVSRRGGYTRNISDPLTILESLLHPVTGFITQSPHLRENLKIITGFISKQEFDRVMAHTDGSWAEACAFARSHLTSRIKEINAIAEKGRDPFEAILPALTSDNPVQLYNKIIEEIRRRIPVRRYAKSRAEAFRSLMMIRIGLLTGLRSKNLRELFVQQKEQCSWKELKRLKRGEIYFDGNICTVRIPREAFKNAPSRAIEDENTIFIPDHDGMYLEIEEYLVQRDVLLAGYDDPNTFFVKTVSSRSSSAEYTQEGYYEAFRSTITTYGIYNPYTGQGAIEGLRPHGPHSVRHILATTMVKLTGGFSEAAALLMDTEEMVRDNYARFLPGERHARAQGILIHSLGGK